MPSNLIAMAFNLLAMASNFNLLAMASNIGAMPSNLIAIASNLLYKTGEENHVYITYVPHDCLKLVDFFWSQ